jgi:hypothetical protein
MQCSALINIMMMVAGGVASPLGDDAVLHVTQRCRDDPSLHGCRRMAAAVEEDTEELRAVAADQLDAATSYMQSLLLLLPPSLVQAATAGLACWLLLLPVVCLLLCHSRFGLRGGCVARWGDVVAEAPHMLQRISVCEGMLILLLALVAVMLQPGVFAGVASFSISAPIARAVYMLLQAHGKASNSTITPQGTITTKQATSEAEAAPWVGATAAAAAEARLRRGQRGRSPSVPRATGSSHGYSTRQSRS